MNSSLYISLIVDTDGDSDPASEGWRARGGRQPWPQTNAWLADKFVVLGMRADPEPVQTAIDGGA